MGAAGERRCVSSIERSLPCACQSHVSLLDRIFVGAPSPEGASCRATSPPASSPRDKFILCTFRAPRFASFQRCPERHLPSAGGPFASIFRALPIVRRFTQSWSRTANCPQQEHANGKTGGSGIAIAIASGKTGGPRGPPVLPFMFLMRTYRGPRPALCETSVSRSDGACSPRRHQLSS